MSRFLLVVAALLGKNRAKTPRRLSKCSTDASRRGESGIPATTVTESWLNAVQESIAYVIETAGVDLEKGNYTTLTEAIRILSDYFIQVGDGAVVRGLISKGRDLVSVKDYGAGEGEDDTLAFSYAALVSPAPGVPAGDYSVDLSTVDISRFQGDGTITYGGQKITLEGALKAKKLAQKKLQELGLGFDNGVANTEIFTGAGSATQGLAYAVVDGVEKIYVTSRCAGASYDTNERCRIVEFSLTNDGSTIGHVSYSAELNIGHGQDLSALVIGAEVYLWAPSATTVAATGAGKGVSKIHWRGAATTGADVTTYILCGASGSGHRREHLYHGTPAVSSDGRYLVFIGENANQSDTHDVLIFDRVAVETGDPLAVDPIYSWRLIEPSHNDGRILQGSACDGQYIYTLAGYYNAAAWHVVQKYDFQGNLIREIPVTTVRQEIGLDGLLNHATLGTPQLIEPEGLAIRGDELIVGMIDDWRAGADIVSYNGLNFAYINPTGSSSGVSPEQMRNWARTAKAAGGAYSVATVYQNGVAYTRRRKSVWSIKTATGTAGELPISPKVFCREANTDVNLSFHQYSQAVNYGESWLVGGYSEQRDAFYRHLEVTPLGAQYLYDARVGSDNTKYGAAFVDFSGATEQFGLRAKGNSLSLGAGLNLYGLGDSTQPGQARLYAVDPSGAVLRTLIFRGATPAFYPGVDNAYSFGIASNRISVVYAGTGTINTSDERAKEEVQPIAEAVLRAWAKVEYCQFKFSDAVVQKGEGARWHFGLIAQRVKEAFESEGLDAFAYGILCYDRWDDVYESLRETREVEDGRGNVFTEDYDTGETVLVTPAGDRYGIRYEEALALECAYLRSRLV